MHTADAHACAQLGSYMPRATCTCPAPSTCTPLRAHACLALQRITWTLLVHCRCRVGGGRPPPPAAAARPPNREEPAAVEAAHESQERQQRKGVHERPRAPPQLRRHDHAEKGARVLRDGQPTLQRREVGRAAVERRRSRLDQRERACRPRVPRTGRMRGRRRRSGNGRRRRKKQLRWRRSWR